MARTEHILRAYEQLHPTIFLLDKAPCLQECNASSMTYMCYMATNIYEESAAYTCKAVHLFQLVLSFSRVMSLYVH